MRSTLIGVGIAWTLSGALAISLVASNPWFIDSLGWYLFFFGGVSAFVGAFVGAALRVLPFWRRWCDSDAAARRLKKALPVLAAMLLMPSAYSATRSNDVASGRPSVLVIGLDGACWEIIDPMREASELPHLSRLIEEGASGVLHSVEPTISPALWTTMATGKLRGRHGIVNFHSTQASLKAKRFWDIAQLADRRIGIMDWLVSWPPILAERGFLVPSHMARGPETIPPELGFLQKLVGTSRNEEAVGVADLIGWGIAGIENGVRLSTAVEALREFIFEVSQQPTYLDKNYRQQRVALLLYRDLFMALRHRYRPDVSAIVFYGTDTLAHKYWRYFEPSAFPDNDPADVEKYGSVITDYYRAADAVVGEILSSVDEKTTVLIVSDHGTEAQGDGSVLRMPRLSGEALVQILGITDWVEVTTIGNETIITSNDDASSDVMSLESVAEILSSAAMNGGVSPFVVDLVDMEGDTGDYIGVSFNLGANLQGDDALQAEIRLDDAESFPLHDIVSTDFDVSGGHHTRGIIIAKGRGIRRGDKIRDAQLPDVAPTVLHLLGLPVGEDMDGKVLVDALEPRFAAANPVRTIPSYGGLDQTSESGDDAEMTDQLRERLKALGYIND